MNTFRALVVVLVSVFALGCESTGYVAGTPEAQPLQCENTAKISYSGMVRNISASPSGSAVIIDPDEASPAAQLFNADGTVTGFTQLQDVAVSGIGPTRSTICASSNDDYVVVEQRVEQGSVIDFIMRVRADGFVKTTTALGGFKNVRCQSTLSADYIVFEDHLSAGVADIYYAQLDSFGAIQFDAKRFVAKVPLNSMFSLASTSDVAFIGDITAVGIFDRGIGSGYKMFIQDEDTTRVVQVVGGVDESNSALLNVIALQDRFVMVWMFLDFETLELSTFLTEVFPNGNIGENYLAPKNGQVIAADGGYLMAWNTVEGDIFRLNIGKFTSQMEILSEGKVELPNGHNEFPTISSVDGKNIIVGLNRFRFDTAEAEGVTAIFTCP